MQAQTHLHSIADSDHYSHAYAAMLMQPCLCSIGQAPGSLTGGKLSKNDKMGPAQRQPPILIICCTGMQGVDVQKMDLRTLLVDPPRSGLDDVTVQLLKEFDSIVYISCNPATLHENLQHIKGSHRIQQLALFDQFPYTDHIECGVLLQRKH
ncbi:hypothetical protein MMC29_000575 [Sticta canariensis]|nr:hypothetical protein [Sticta canariensis]